MSNSIASAGSYSPSSGNSSPGVEAGRVCSMDGGAAGRAGANCARVLSTDAKSGG